MAENNKIPKIGLFVDMDSLYKGHQMQYPNTSLDYKKLYDAVKKFPNRTGDAKISIAVAYYVQLVNEKNEPMYKIDESFLDSMKINGYEIRIIKKVRYRGLEKELRFINGINSKPIMDPTSPLTCMMTVDMLDHFNDVDMFVICTNIGNFEPLFEYLVNNGKFVEIFGHGRYLQYSIRRGASRVRLIKKDLNRDGEVNDRSK